MGESSQSINGEIAPIKPAATLILRGKKYDVKAGSTLLFALKKLEILPEAVICARDGELITEDAIIQDGEIIKLVSVISGG